MSGKAHIAVLGSDGRPLMPCTAKRARLLLERGRAFVKRIEPFVIQLKDRSQDDCELQPMSVKIDPGSRFTGICVARVPEPGVVKVIRLIELEHRGMMIKLRLIARAAYRRNRRNRNTRYRQLRFLNRTKPKGWLAPSLMHRVNTTLSWVRRLTCWYPIVEIAMERVKFDTQKLQNPLISGKEYQQGTLMGYEIREYLLEKWDCKCAYCGTDKVVRFEIDHVIPRSKGGSNRISNLVLACCDCNKAKGAMSVEEFMAHAPEKLLRLKGKLKVPLHDSAAANATRNRFLAELLKTGLPVETGTGGQTKYNRCRLSVPKTHALDAACVGTVNSIDHWRRSTLKVKCTGRGRYCRTTTNAYGFPRQYFARQKKAFGFQTGDLVRAIRPRVNQIVRGRINVRQNGGFVIDTKDGLSTATWKFCTRLQYADGYSYQNHWLPEMLYAQQKLH